ncbi:hypothetical protein K435DRAFT_790441 [Dendrothele bispora CBS 962.96]|uniref:EF-hand domain-containing protein n=1 Tax=Dendrothele bispora (strain CBS 962.96) TaxID=1314807 RepID=A0A4S8MQ15_DENBC|nr:hypothetical protein K435DRAFT_790441 [Dendrothele bispora CBS 962.96]
MSSTPMSEEGPNMPRPQPHRRPTSQRNPSWDLLGGFKRFEHEYEEFDTRHASENHLAFAEGDIPQNRASKLYHYLLNVSIVTRWFLFIVPVLGILWIPAILQLTTFPHAEVWAVPLLWWSIWLSVVWGGWWGSLAVARILPSIIRSTVGVIAVSTRKYIDWAGALHRYVALFAWTLGIWVSWNPLVDNRQRDDASDKSRHIIDLIGKLLFGFYLCAAVLLFEKFSIQWIAGKFHERSYAERIADQKFAVRSLVTLYRNSSDIPGRSDTLKAADAKQNGVKILKRAMKGVRDAATTTTTALGNVASEIAGSSVLQPNSPQAMVKTALESANKSRLLARRLFYSFVRPGHEYLFPDDIARFFPTREEADKVFGLFDRDGNGDASRNEIELACMDFHREQLSIEHSMQDLDSAVGRLDNIFMSLYVIIAALIIAVCLEAQFTNLVASAGTLVLGLSWLIGGSLTEVLTSIIFLFIKHPFDVGDRIILEEEGYTVKEIRLLSTILLNDKGAYVQAPNSELSTMFIQNIRRSPPMSETFTFDVGFDTNFDHLETLRSKMLQFLSDNRRDYLYAFDVSVVDFPEQEKITLSADIKYKSNWQQGALKAKRRNKWICALKEALVDIGIFGPQGDPDKPAAPIKYTEVPWDEVKKQSKTVKHVSMPAPPGGWHLSDQNPGMHDSSDNVFDDTNELHLTTPVAGYVPPTQHAGDGSMTSEVSMPPGLPTTMPSVVTMPSHPEASSGDYFEMTTRR